MIKQRTIKNTIRATGVGLHTGQKVYLTLILQSQTQVLYSDVLILILQCLLPLPQKMLVTPICIRRW